MSKAKRSNERRAGMSILELQMAMIVFGIVLAGLAPLVVMQLKQLQKLEQRLSDHKTYYLVPTNDPWARKLGAAAAISSTDPGAPGTPGWLSPANNVQILSLEKSFAGDEMTVHTSITAVPP